MIIPDFQPIPFPSPLWLLITLLIAGFFLHVIPMNVALGSGLISGLLMLKNGDDPNHYGTRIARSLIMSLPVFISFAITQGIVPLLFLQLVYGPLYYTSSVIIAWPWLLLLVVLLTGYYLTYVAKSNIDKIGKNTGWLLILVTVLFAGVGFMFTNNMTLMLTPDRWDALMETSRYGWVLNLTDPQVLPRFLHFFLAAFAVTGLAIGCFGLYWKSREEGYGKWLIQTGSAIYLAITLIQLGVGGWFLMALPREVMLNYMGHDTLGTIMFGGSMVFSILSILFLLPAWKNGSGGAFKGGLVSAGLTIILMVVMRHLLRVYFTADFFDPATVPVQTQWDLLIAFLITAVITVFYVIWLAKTAWTAFNQPVDELAELTKSSEQANA